MSNLKARNFQQEGSDVVSTTFGLPNGVTVDVKVTGSMFIPGDEVGLVFDRISDALEHLLDDRI